MQQCLYVQVQAEVKKAWIRRSLALDLKQKARVTSSGGSCYYGGMTSQATNSVSLSMAATKGLALTGGRQRLAPLHPLSSLPGYVPGSSEVSLPSPAQQEPVQRRPALLPSRPRAVERSSQEREAVPPLSSDEEPSPCSLSIKEFETIL